MQISNLQISKQNWHAGLTTANHLRTFFLTKPEMASQIVTRAYNKGNGYKNALSFLTGGMGKAKVMNDINYRWSIMGDSRKAISITRSYFDGISGSLGIAGTTFKVGVGEKWFVLGDVIVPDDNRYSLRVMSHPEDNGVDIILELKLVTADQTSGNSGVNGWMRLKLL